MAERRIRKQNKAAEFCLSMEDVRRLFDVSGLRDRCLLKALYYAALRRAEALGLEIRDIDFERGLLRVRKGKGAKERFVPIHREELAPDLRQLIGDRTAGHVFAGQKGGALTTRYANMITEEAGIRAKVMNPNPRLTTINPHLLRHTFARHYLAAGGSLRDLSHILGHSGIQITANVYGTPTVEDLLDGYRKTADAMKHRGEG